MAEPIQRTMNAQQAFDAAEIFGLKFAGVTLGSSMRKVRLVAPDGMSTGGGKAARQSIVLAADETSGAGNLVAGWLDVSAKSAEVRSYNLLNQQYQARFAKDIDVTRSEYEPLMKNIEGFLKAQKIDYRVLDASISAPRPAQIASKQPTGLSTNSAVALAIAALAIALTLGFVLFR